VAAPDKGASDGSDTDSVVLPVQAPSTTETASAVTTALIGVVTAPRAPPRSWPSPCLGISAS